MLRIFQSITAPARLKEAKTRLEMKEPLKPIDNVTVELMDIALRAVGIRLDKKDIDKIIDIVELIEDKGEATSIKDIAALELEWSASSSYKK